MKNYLVFLFVGLISFNMCARSNMSKFADQLLDVVGFYFDHNAAQNELESIVHEYIKQVKYPYARHMIKVGNQRVYITLLDYFMMQRVYLDRYSPQIGEPEWQSCSKNTNFLIALLKQQGFKQTIEDHDLERAIRFCNHDSECLACDACELAHMGLTKLTL